MMELVERYGSRAHHRTGSQYDSETIDWLATMLRSDGAATEVSRWSFPQWLAEWSAELDGHAIDALPIFYEHSESEDVTVVATPHRKGRLYATNRHPVTTRTRKRTINVAGCFAHRVDDVVARISNVRLVDGTSANVCARWDGTGSRVVVATPISGWFSCASERGCGIAIARSLALASEGRSVELLFTSGHELFNIGLTHYLRERTHDVGAVVHVGASVAAAGDGPHGLSSQLFVTSNVDRLQSQHGRRHGSTDDGLRYRPHQLRSLGYHERDGGTNEKDWIGEARQWQQLGVPLLSVAGVSEWFHTPNDVPDLATSQTLLVDVANALLGDVHAFLGSVFEP
jgi:hypothetical protein